MSRNIRGVPAFIIGDEVVVGLDISKIEQLLDYKVISCHKCSTRLRIPKNKGTIELTCPKCSEIFRVNTK